MRAAALLVAWVAVAAGAPAFNILPAGKPTTSRGLQLFPRPFLSEPSDTTSSSSDSSSEDNSSSTGGGGSSGDGEGTISGASSNDDETEVGANDGGAGSPSVQKSVPSSDTPAAEATRPNAPSEPSPQEGDVTDVASSQPQSADGGTASADAGSVSGSSAAATDSSAVVTRTAVFASGQQFTTGDAATVSRTVGQSGILSPLGGIQTEARFGGVTVNEGSLKGSIFSQGGTSLLPGFPQTLPDLGNPHKHLSFVTQLTSGHAPKKVEENKVESVESKPKRGKNKKKRGRGQAKRERSTSKPEPTVEKPEPTAGKPEPTVKKPEATGEKASS